MSVQSEFNVLRFSQIATTQGRDLTLKEKPAVYAWYRHLSLSDALGTSERFVARIEELLAAKLGDQCVGRLGYLYEVQVQESSGKLSPRSLQLLQTIAQDDAARIHLANVLEPATFLQAPLYVGKAISLRRRIGEHVKGASGLLARLESAGIAMQNCVLRYKYLNENDVDTLLGALPQDSELLSGQAKDDALATLLEELLTRFSPSAFVHRPG